MMKDDDFYENKKKLNSFKEKMLVALNIQNNQYLKKIDEQRAEYPKFTFYIFPDEKMFRKMG